MLLHICRILIKFYLPVKRKRTQKVNINIRIFVLGVEFYLNLKQSVFYENNNNFKYLNLILFFKLF